MVARPGPVEVGLRTPGGGHRLGTSPEGGGADGGGPGRGHHGAGGRDGGESPAVLVTVEGRERAGVCVAGPPAVQAGQGTPAGLGGTVVVGGAGTAGGGDQGVGGVGLSPGAGGVEGAVSGRQSVLW